MERTVPALINIDFEDKSKNIKIDGKLETILTELSFVVSFIYSKMTLEGYSFDKIKDILILAIQNGIFEGKKIDKELLERRQ